MDSNVVISGTININIDLSRLECNFLTESGENHKFQLNYEYSKQIGKLASAIGPHWFQELKPQEN